MSFDTDFLAFAKDSIETYGAAMTLRKPGSDTYDPATGNLTTASADYAVNALIESYSEFHVAKGLVKAGDRRIIIAAASLSVTPQQGDTLILGGQSLLIVNVKSEYAGSTPILHTLQVRN